MTVIIRKRYREFATENADYRLNYGFHILPSKVENVEDYDALVLESGCLKYEEWDYSDFVSHIQLKSYLQKNDELDEPRPIFNVDLPKILYKGIELDALLKAATFGTGLLTLPYGLPLMLPLVAKVFSLGINSKHGKVLSYISLLDSFSLSSIRSAVSAQKIESFVAPEMRERIKHKPYIFIDYGAFHCDMEPFLKHPRLRKLESKLAKAFPFTLDLSYLDKVQEFRNENSIEPSNFGKSKIVKKSHEFNRWERILYQI